MSKPEEDGEIRVVSGMVHPFEQSPVMGLLVQISVPDSDAEGWLLTTHHWEDLCPLSDYAMLYGHEGLTAEQYALSRQLRALYDAGQPLPPH